MFQTLPGLFCISTSCGTCDLESEAKSFKPSRDYSAFLPFSRKRDELSQGQVSNPSQGYSAFLHAQEMTRPAKRFLSFNPPGIILHFNTQVVEGEPADESRFKPFQGLFCISTSFAHPQPRFIFSCFKPFQGLFCISTGGDYGKHCGFFHVSNPSRDYSAFLRFLWVKYQTSCFRVSNPSRDYSAFLPLEILEQLQDGRMFQTLPGIIRILLQKQSILFTQNLKFQTLQGLFCISTLILTAGLTCQNIQFQTLPGIILHFYRHE
jgi:hypothetical protein